MGLTHNSPATAAHDVTLQDDDAHAPDESTVSGLLPIALFKLSKAVFFFLIGLGMLHLIHRNLGELVLHTATVLHLDPDGQIVGRIMDRADLVSGHDLRVAGALSIFYSFLAATEGFGLLLHKVWAEYLTLGMTLAAIPVELVEMVRHPDLLRLSLLIINLLVVGYLLWFLRAKHRSVSA